MRRTISTRTITPSGPRPQAGQGWPDRVGTSELSFDNVFVPAENVLGEIDRGFVYMMERLAQERVGAAVLGGL